MNLKGSQTEINLLTAFAGESQARNRYTFFAEKAKEEGMRQIAAIFNETADQERAHAMRIFKFLKGGEVEITAAFPAGVIGSTVDNLKAGAAGEHYEWEEMYPSFAQTASEEGFDSIASAFMSIANAEKQHEKRYLDLAGNIEKGLVFQREQPVVWRCMNCGYLHEGPEAPKGCPACAVNQSFYEILAENW